MPIRILAVLTETQTARACLEGALAAAAVEADVQIEALHVRVDPDKLLRASEELAFQRFRERYEGTAQDRANSIRGVFEAWVAGLPVSMAARVRWREDVGAEQDKVIEEACKADLLVLARPHNMDGGDAMHAAVFEVHRPLMVPPDWAIGPDHGFDGHLVIAWNGTRQAKDAVEGAAPWLRRAARVTLVMIANDERAGGRDDAEHLLHEIGVTAEILLVAPVGREPAEQILRIAHDQKADALVMGAYRHHDMIEWALGGTTRQVLARAQIPLFLAH